MTTKSKGKYKSIETVYGDKITIHDSGFIEINEVTFSYIGKRDCTIWCNGSTKDEVTIVGRDNPRLKVDYNDCYVNKQKQSFQG